MSADTPAGSVTRRCVQCAAHISADFARVFGDADSTVYACPSCASGSALRDGAAAQPGGDKA